MSIIPTSYDDNQNEIDAYIAKAQAVALCLSQQESLESLHPHTIIEILALISDQLDGISKLNNKNWEIIREVKRNKKTDKQRML